MSGGSDGTFGGPAWWEDPSDLPSPMLGCCWQRVLVMEVPLGNVLMGSDHARRGLQPTLAQDSDSCLHLVAN